MATENTTKICYSCKIEQSTNNFVKNSQSKDGLYPSCKECQRAKRKQPLTMSEDDLTRFWSKVDKSGECWLWTASVDKDGYGQFSCRKVDIRAHRVAYMLINGKWQNGMVICHVCDNPRCVNPLHLFEATQDENNKDKAQKGRSYQGKGEQATCVKLTEQQVREIRQKHKNGALFKTLMAEYSVSYGAIGGIIYRHTWKHID